VKTLSKLLATGRVDNALLGGLLGQLFLITKGLIPTEYSAPIKGFESAVETAKELLEKYPDTLVLPEDAAVERDGKRFECAFNEMDGDPFFDIGPSTAKKYTRMISEAAAVFANGPLGFFEKEPFAKGTLSVRVTVVAGGHLGAMAINEGFADRVSHISTGGGATINFLTAKKLDLVVALEEAAQRMV